MSRDRNISVMKGKLKLLIGSVVALTVGVSFAQQNVSRIDGKDMAFKPLQPHPRLFATQEEFSRQKVRLNSAPEGRVALEGLLRKADKLLDVAPVERKMTGRRLLSVSRTAVDRIGTLAFAWKMTHERKYAERAADEARAVCRFSDWNPSHFLDVGEMTLAVALARDWLDDAVCEADKRLFSESILMKGLTKGDGCTLSDGWWRFTWSNWNQVCNGGLAVGAAAVREDYPLIAEEVLRRSRLGLPLAMASYAGGNFPEGVSYWEYASDYNMLALDVLEDQFADGAADLFATPGLAEQADYVNLMTGPTALCFNYSDTSQVLSAAPMAACWYLALRFKRFDTLEAFQRPLLAKGKNAGRMTHFMLLWFRPKSDAEPSARTLCRALGGMNPVAVLRSGWKKDDWYVGIKAGSPSVNHGHMDAGSFVLDRDGVRWAIDLGCEGYNRIEQMKTISLWDMRQESSRWSLYRLNTQGHGTLTIDDAAQKVKGFAKVLSVKDKPYPEAVVDLSDLYPAAEKVLRSFEIKDGALTLRDRLEGLAAGAKVKWNMNTTASTSLDVQVLTLAAKNAQGEARALKLTIEGVDSAWKTKPLDNMDNPADSPNKGVTRVYFECPAPQDGKLAFSVRFESVDVK
jgi:hypothetical protein